MGGAVTPHFSTSKHNTVCASADVQLPHFIADIAMAPLLLKAVVTHLQALQSFRRLIANGITSNMVYKPVFAPNDTWFRTEKIFHI